jgi:hypothetical protein
MAKENEAKRKDMQMKVSYRGYIEIVLDIPWQLCSSMWPLEYDLQSFN